MAKGIFLTLEGIDGCGKTTQARILAGNLASRLGNEAVLWTKEPGGWAGGEMIRALLLQQGMQHPLSELFLFLADRCEHIKEVIAPALDAGKIVVCERFTDSTLAYQSWGRKISLEKIEDLFRWCAFPVPDLTFWIDLPPGKACHRVSRRGGLDRMEEKGKIFLENVRNGFLFLSEREPERIIRLDGDKDIEAIAQEIARRVEVVFPREGQEKRR
ncbi:dTMP kinase [Aminivibrio sp.]|uniref:dTMP kinase n=1 Tax=Aminivibrio sp. TaxID=1872489 RepID=UPI001A37FC72|nr:dTMP kinase [Aminivibrio sp.]MBL3538607.1 dTMP kinase [Aminivibrio sp.]